MMISRALLSVGVLTLAWACGSASKPKPAEFPDAEPAEEAPAPAATEEKTGTEGWSEAAPTTSSAEDTEAPPKRQKGRVVVKSDPKRHGDEINFDFSVNGTRMDGPFRLPGGQTFTFSLPAGTVSYAVAECGGRGGGFELDADGEITLTCYKRGGGDCCGVAPKVVAGAKAAGGKKAKKKAEPAAAE